MQLKLVEDGYTLAGMRKTQDGYLVGTVLCARTGIQDYLGAEVGRPDLPIVRVYRPEESVFSKDSLSTYAGKPATNDHPVVPVTADNWKQLSVGSIGSEVAREGEYVRVSLALMDAAAISAVEGGKRELSMGYEMTLDFESGTTPDGQAYDAVMRDLRMNHVAIVDKGRAGPKARIGDNWGDTSSPTNNKDGGVKPLNTRTIIIDGLSVETTEAGAQALEKLQSEKQALVDAAKTEKETHSAELAAKDSVIADKDSEIKSLKEQVLDDAAIDVRVAARTELVEKAKSFTGDADLSGKSDLEIKTAAVVAARDGDFVAGKDAAYINAAFDMLEAPAKASNPDKFRASMQSRDNASASSNDNGYGEYKKRLGDAWKGEQA